MPRYTHRGRSSSSSSSSASHSPAPKHRSRSPRNSSSNRYSSNNRSPPKRAGDRRSSRSPRRRYSPPRRSSPGRQNSRRPTSSYHSSRCSPSPRRRSPPRRSSPGRRRSKSPGYARARSPGYSKSRRSPSPRSRYHGSSPSRSSRRSPPKQRSPPRESARQTDSHGATDNASRPSSYLPESRQEPIRQEPVLSERPSVVPGLEPEPPRQHDWIPGLDLEPEPVPTSSSILHEAEPLRAREQDTREQREKPMESSSRLSYPHSDSRDDRDHYRSSSHELNVSSSTRHQEELPGLETHGSHEPRQTARRSRSPQYVSSRSMPETSRSPVGQRHEAERDFGWVHPRIEPSRAGIPADPVRISVNLPDSPNDIDLRRDRSSTAPWERKRQDQDLRAQREAKERREAEELREQELHSRSSHHHPASASSSRAEPLHSAPVAKSSDTHRYFPPSSASTRGSLSSRFGAGTANEHPFFPKENITVGIQRNLKDADEHAPIKRHFVETEVVVARRKDEGETPLSLREEFVTREEEEEVEERRVIKVVKMDEKPPSHREVRRENFEIRKEYYTKPSLSDRWKERDDHMVESSSSVRESRKDSSYRAQGDVRYVDKKDERHVTTKRSREDDRKRSPVSARHTDHDERRVADSGRRSQRQEPEYRRSSSSWDRKRERFEQDPSDLRHNLSSKRRFEKDDFRPERQERDIRSRIGERRDDSRGHKQGGSNPPDFSNRQDKYTYEEWKDRPEMIPKGSSYYEHDNRDTYVPRARGRGFFRGRGGFRGRGFTPYRGRGFRGRGRGYVRGRGFLSKFRRNSSDYEREWKHDKFSEMEDNKDERPSSTTEK